MSLAVLVAVAGPAAAASRPAALRAIVADEAGRRVSPALVAAAAATDPELAARAALALGRTRSALAIAALQRRAADPDPAVRAMTIFGLGLLAGHGSVDPAPVRAALLAPEPSVRLVAADAAGRLLAAEPAADRALGTALLAALRDVAAPVRARAAVALANVPQPDPAAGPALRSAFALEADPAARWHEAWALRRSFRTALAPAAIAAGLRDRDALVRMQFLALIRSRGLHELAPAARALAARDPDWRVREEADQTLTVLGGGARSEHLLAIPPAVATPAALPAEREPALPRRPAGGPPHAPAARDAAFDLPFLPRTLADLSGPFAGRHPRVRIATTQGPIVLRLFPEWAPLTVANFLDLVNRGYYDGLRWFRIVPNFVVQTGDPHDNGAGDAGYMIPAEETPLDIAAGTVSMGLNYSDGAQPAPLRDTAGAQFFIALSPQLHLNPNFTAFGAVERGFSTLGRLVERDRMLRVERIADE